MILSKFGIFSIMIMIMIMIIPSAIMSQDALPSTHPGQLQNLPSVAAWRNDKVMLAGSYGKPRSTLTEKNTVIEDTDSSVSIGFAGAINVGGWIFEAGLLPRHDEKVLITDNGTTSYKESSSEKLYGNGAVLANNVLGLGAGFRLDKNIMTYSGTGSSNSSNVRSEETQLQQFLASGTYGIGFLAFSLGSTLVRRISSDRADNMWFDTEVAVAGHFGSVMESVDVGVSLTRSPESKKPFEGNKTYHHHPAALTMALSFSGRYQMLRGEFQSFRQKRSAVLASLKPADISGKSLAIGVFLPSTSYSIHGIYSTVDETEGIYDRESSMLEISLAYAH